MDEPKRGAGRPTGTAIPGQSRMAHQLGGWVQEGACGNLMQPFSDWLFFNDTDSLLLQERLRATAWEQFCSHCPVRVECFTFAMIHREPGIWGGTLWHERRTLRESPVKTQVVLDGLQRGMLYRVRAAGTLDLLRDDGDDQREM